MRTVWKYSIWTDEVAPNQDVFIEMPGFAKLLYVQIVNDQPVVYAEVNSGRAKVRRRFHLVWTGYLVPPGSSPDADLQYVGTFENHTLIYHLYVDPEEHPLS